MSFSLLYAARTQDVWLNGEWLCRAIGRDPEIFPDGDEFKPGRWLDKDGKVKPDMKVSHRLSVSYTDNLTASNILLYSTKSTPSFLLSALEDGIYFSFSLRPGIRTDHILRCEYSICPGAEVATRYISTLVRANTCLSMSLCLKLTRIDPCSSIPPSSFGPSASRQTPSDLSIRLRSEKESSRFRFHSPCSLKREGWA